MVQFSLGEGLRPRRDVTEGLQTSVKLHQIKDYIPIIKTKRLSHESRSHTSNSLITIPHKSQRVPRLVLAIINSS